MDQWQLKGKNNIYRTLTTIGTIESTAAYWPKEWLRNAASAATTLKVYRAQLSTSVNMISQCGLEPRRWFPTRKIRNAIAPNRV